MKLVGVSVLGLSLAFALFYLADSVVMPWLLYSERFAGFWQRRNEAAVQAYQDRVTELGLSVDQAVRDAEGQLGGLCTILVGTPLGEREVDLPGSAWTVEEDESSRYHFIWAETSGASAPAADAVSVVTELHQIRCADGVVYVSSAPAVLWYAGLGRGLGLLAALLGFCAVVVPCIVRLLRRIGALSREAEVLMGGDLDHAIHVTGRDELSGLGEDIERLRRSVLERIQGEREAVAANSRLITSLSHDLRTPLTKLTGYLDILLYHKYQTQEEQEKFLRLAAEKTAQLKALTDQMFASAQVDAPRAPLEEPPEVVDGAALLGQLLEEQCGDLCREGFDAQPPAFARAFQLNLRTADAVRIFDNLFSNLKKYADPAAPVDVRVEDGLDSVSLRVENRIRAVPDRADSHGLGVPTMGELLERAGGRLEVSRQGDRYVSRLTFPKYREHRQAGEK